jgi:hypothetical protein
MSTPNNRNLVRSENLSIIGSQGKNDNVISELVSELFNHIESKDSFDFISDLLITSLNIYKKKFSVKDYSLKLEKKLNFDEKTEINSFKQNESDVRSEYLSISNDIHSILSNCPDLTSNQKLDYCNSQRYFIKLYLKEMVIKINGK